MFKEGDSVNVMSPLFHEDTVWIVTGKKGDDLYVKRGENSKGQILVSPSLLRLAPRYANG